MRQVSYLNKAFSAQARIIPHLPENHVGRYAEKPQYKRFSNKPCLPSKEVLFTMQRSLVCNTNKASFKTRQNGRRRRLSHHPLAARQERDDSGGKIAAHKGADSY